MNETQDVETGRRVRRRWNQEARQQLLASWRVSGKGRREFCAEEGIGYSTMCAWLRKEAGGEAPPPKGTVEVSPLAWMGESVVAEVVWADGRRVRVMRGCPEGVWGRLVEAVGRCGP